MHILKSNFVRVSLTLIGIFSSSVFCWAQIGAQKTRLGAYYFDGWTSSNPKFLRSKLVEDFPEREPKWGWMTSSQRIMELQILSAKKSGLSFFAFCWFQNEKKNAEPELLNNSLSYFKRSNNKSLDFCIMVANHEGYRIGPIDWPKVTNEWILNFKEVNYLKIENKPVIIFYSLSKLLELFGKTQNIKSALDEFRARAAAEGIKGIQIAVCVGTSKTEIKNAELSGFDILTGYNYHSAGLDTDKVVSNISNMTAMEVNIWNEIQTSTKLKYMPVSTLNWDSRPWIKHNPQFEKRFVGFSRESVRNSVEKSKNWLETRYVTSPSNKVGLLYAWNEYGEGSYLTPTKAHGNEVLKGVKDALKN